MNAERFKYPRTRHLPSSRSKTDDDRIAPAAQVETALKGVEVVITEKMDGESTTIYADGHSHARSIDSKAHPSRSIVRELAATVAHELPATMRICGENIFAVHSIEYTALEAHFQVYNIWDGEECLSWDETEEWVALLGLTTVPVLYRGVWQGETEARNIWETHRESQEAVLGQTSEGFVVRPAAGFHREEFGERVFKWVRPKHVQTGTHWMHQEMKVNKLQ